MLQLVTLTSILAAQLNTIDGYPPGLFEKSPLITSGHIHKRSKNKIHHHEIPKRRNKDVD